MRTYRQAREFFHNFEHDKLGRRHCKGGASNPYVISHVDGKHKISTRFARGHGRGAQPQWFRFTRRLGNGWDLASGVKVDVGDVPPQFKTLSGR